MSMKQTDRPAAAALRLLQVVEPSGGGYAFRTMDPTLGRDGRLIYGAIETALAAEVRKNRFTLGQMLDRTEEIYRRLAERRRG